MSIVVSDTSPVRALHHLELLEVLGHLFGQVFLPPAVVSELSNPPQRFDSVDVSGYDFIEIRAPQDVAQVQQFVQVLDAGESEALVLALELGAEALLIDESDGRAIAVRGRSALNR